MYRKTYIEINTENLAHNTREVLSAYPGYLYYVAVVKGNAYGHGYKSVQTLVDAGVNYLAVSNLEEALELRKEISNTPILILQPIHIEDVVEAVKHNIAITVSNYEYFKKLNTTTIEGTIKVHIKINSGFNRLGISQKEQVKEIFDTLRHSTTCILEGIYSHFMTSGRNDDHFAAQLVAFKEIVSLIDLTQIPIVHLDRSLTLSSHKKIDFCTATRVGISLYGYGQSMGVSTGLKGFLKSMFRKTPDSSIVDISTKLTPAFAMYGEVIETHKIKKGESVGYGAMFTASTDCSTACISFGYADGFFRKNKGGDVAIGGKRYQIISVDMGIVTILVDESVQVGDIAEFIGKTISAKEVAVRNDTTIYEILSSPKEIIPRMLIKNK